jgi:hypothetical protein
MPSSGQGEELGDWRSRPGPLSSSVMPHLLQQNDLGGCLRARARITFRRECRAFQVQGAAIQWIGATAPPATIVQERRRRECPPVAAPGRRTARAMHTRAPLTSTGNTGRHQQNAKRFSQEPTARAVAYCPGTAPVVRRRAARSRSGPRLRRAPCQIDPEAARRHRLLSELPAQLQASLDPAREAAVAPDRYEAKPLFQPLGHAFA